MAQQKATWFKEIKLISQCCLKYESTVIYIAKDHIAMHTIFFKLEMALYSLVIKWHNWCKYSVCNITLYYVPITQSCLYAAQAT